MQTLVICIDRDNDLGEKANIETPVVGREANIQAAVRLAIADPEDSDANTIFGGIKVLDELRERNMDAEIVSFAGDKNVGVISDQMIAEQLDAFLENHEIKRAIFISDGAEDETLIPIVQSRIKIDSVKRIIVMQSEKLESTYYILKNAFSDPKISHTFFVPLGLASLIYAIFLLARYPEGAIIGILAAIGLYMLYRGFGLDDTFALQANRLKDSFYKKRMSFITSTAAVMLGIVATLQGAIQVWQLYSGGGAWYYGALTLVSVFIKASVWWYAAAVMLVSFGKMYDLRLAEKSVIKTLSALLYVFAAGLLFWGASNYILSISALTSDSLAGAETALQYFVYSIVFAIIIALSGIKLSLSPRGPK